MTSSSKDQTESTPPSSSGESTEGRVQPSGPSAKTDNTKPSMTTTPKPLPPTSGGVKRDEKVLSAKDLMKASLQILERRGLIRRFRMLSKDRTTVRAIVIVFDNTFWTPDLELKE